MSFSALKFLLLKRAESDTESDDDDDRRPRAESKQATHDPAEDVKVEQFTEDEVRSLSVTNSIFL